MNFSSSLLNEFLQKGGTINGRPVAGVARNEIVELPSSIAPSTQSNMNTRINRKRKEMRTAKKPPSDDIKTLLEKEDLNKKDVELYFLNKLLRLISAEEED